MGFGLEDDGEFVLGIDAGYFGETAARLGNKRITSNDNSESGLASDNSNPPLATTKIMIKISG